VPASIEGVLLDLLAMNDPVEEHIQAYNERDLERFVACFSADCVMEDARGAVVARGHEELRAGFGRLFAENPELHCEVVQRVHVGEFVVDEERITGRDGGEQHAVVVSHVSGGVIVHQRVIR
jgi:hypothetical protein